MTDRVRVAPCGGDHGSSCPIELVHHDQADVERSNFDTPGPQIALTKLRDEGNNLTRSDVELSVRPTSSDSGHDAVFTDSQESENDLLSRLAVSPSNDRPNFGEVKVFDKPSVPSPAEMNSGFVFAAAKPRHFATFDNQRTVQPASPQKPEQVSTSSTPPQQATEVASPTALSSSILAISQQQTCTSPLVLPPDQPTSAQPDQSSQGHCARGSDVLSDNTKSNVPDCLDTTEQDPSPVSTDVTSKDPPGVDSSRVPEENRLVTMKRGPSSIVPAAVKPQPASKHRSAFASRRKQTGPRRKAKARQTVYFLPDDADPINISGTTRALPIPLNSAVASQPASPDSHDSWCGAGLATIISPRPGQAVHTGDVQALEHAVASHAVLIPPIFNADQNITHAPGAGESSVRSDTIASCDTSGNNQAPIDPPTPEDSDAVILPANESREVLVCDQPRASDSNAPASSSSMSHGSIKKQSRLTSSSLGRKKAEAILHSICDRSGPIRVVKSSRPTPSGGTSLCLEDYTQSASKLRSIVKSMRSVMNDETRSCLEEASQHIDTARAELLRALESNEELTKELQDTKSHQARIDALAATGSRLTKFCKGLGTDLSRLQAQSDTAKEANTKTTALYKDLEIAMKLQRRTKSDIASLRQETLNANIVMMEEKNVLEKRLSEKAGELSELKDLCAVLTRQLDKPGMESAVMKKLYQEFKEELSEKLCALNEAVSNKAKDEELHKIVRKCSDGFERLDQESQGSSGRFAELKSLVEMLSSDTQKHFDDARAAAAKLVDLPTKEDSGDGIVELLEAMKAEFRSHEDHAEKATLLREKIAKFEVAKVESERTIADLASKAVEHHSNMSSLQERITQLEATNSALQNERSSSEFMRANLQNVMSENYEMRQQIPDTQAELASCTSKLATITVELHDCQRERENLQRRLSQIEDQLASDVAAAPVPDFEVAKDRLEEDFRRNLETQRKELTGRAIADQSKLTSRLRQAELQKQLCEKKLANVLSEAEPLRAEVQLLKEQSQDSSMKEKTAKDSIDSLTSRLVAEDARLHRASIDQATANSDMENLRLTITKLQATQNLNDSSLEQKQKELHDLQKQLETESSAKEAAESEYQRVQLNHNEGLVLQQSNGELTTRVLVLRQEKAELQEKLDAHDHARQDVQNRAARTDRSPIPDQQQSRNRGSSATAHSDDCSALPGAADIDASSRRPGCSVRRLKKLDRNPGFSPQIMNGRVEVVQSTQEGTETQLGDVEEEVMLDDHQSTTRESSMSDFDEDALDKQVLDHDGVRTAGGWSPAAIEETQSQTQYYSHDQREYMGFSQRDSSMHPPSVVEESQSQDPGPSSPLSPSRSSWNKYRQIAAEESQSNIQRFASQTDALENPSWTDHGPASTLRTSQDDKSRAPRRSSAISQGKKRDPVQGLVATPSASKHDLRSTTKFNTRQSASRGYEASEMSSSPGFVEDESQLGNSEKHRNGSLQGLTDIYDVMKSATPVRHVPKRLASQRPDSGSRHGKRARVDKAGAPPTPRAASGLPSTESSHGRFASTSQGAQGVTSVARQLSAAKHGTRGPDKMTSTRKTKAKTVSKMDDRFQQESDKKN